MEVNDKKSEIFYIGIKLLIGKNLELLEKYCKKNTIETYNVFTNCFTCFTTSSIVCNCCSVDSGLFKVVSIL